MHLQKKPHSAQMAECGLLKEIRELEVLRCAAAASDSVKKDDSDQVSSGWFRDGDEVAGRVGEIDFVDIHILTRIDEIVVDGELCRSRYSVIVDADAHSRCINIRSLINSISGYSWG